MRLACILLGPIYFKSKLERQWDGKWLSNLSVSCFLSVGIHIYPLVPDQGNRRIFCSYLQLLMRVDHSYFFTSVIKQIGGFLGMSYIYFPISDLLLCFKIVTSFYDPAHSIIQINILKIK